ncbi:hypothetical protein ACFPRL_36145 [Pseudoclavibacter helvolus]
MRRRNDDINHLKVVLGCTTNFYGRLAPQEVPCGHGKTEARCRRSVRAEPEPHRSPRVGRPQYVAVEVG